MVFVTSQISINWLSNDAWSEAFIGTRRIVYEILPSSNSEQKAEDGALCQLAIIGSNHLMEYALFDLLKPYVNSTNDKFSISKKKLENASYFFALKNLLPKIAEQPVNLNYEPLKSTETLRMRRNETIHKTSAIATVEMSRSALFSAVEGTKYLYQICGQGFKYSSFLNKYPLSKEKYFSTITYP
ncbi:MAG: hypothetical protein RBR08_13945 [Desulforegulaceae bacterium]|nr:hypothetical protein [Desulforegulaceae bacterium]